MIYNNFSCTHPTVARIYIKEIERAKNHGRTKLRLVFSLLAYKYTTDTKERERERRTKEENVCGGQIDLFCRCVQSRCGKGGGAGIHKNGHHLSELA